MPPKTEMKQWFREHLISWVNTRRNGHVFNGLDDVSRSKEMTRFYVSEVLAVTNPGIVPDDLDSIDEYLVDGADDAGVDFIYSAEGQVVIIQSKYHRSGATEGASEFSHFCDVLQRLHDAARGKYKVNRKLRDLLGDIDWKNDAFILHFCCLARATEPMRLKEDNGLDPIPSLPDLQNRSFLTLLAETELNESLRDKLSSEQGADLDVRIRLADNGDESSWINFAAPEGREMYIGLVTGAELCELWQPVKNRLRLFAMNIRDYIGETATNKQIAVTASTTPDDFVFYNNGIAAVASQVTPDDDDPRILVCKQFSIINGAQTVKSLTKAKRMNNDALRQAKVLIRIVQFRAGKDGEFLSNVTRYNNTQNVMKISDFRSNDVVQKSVRSQFGQISVDSKQCQYRNKRSKEKDSNKFIIGMEVFAKTVHAFLYGPDDMWGGTKKLFTLDEKDGGRYSYVFGDPNAPMAPDEFKFLVGIYFVCYEIEETWKEKRIRDEQDLKNLPALERKLLVFSGIGEYLRLAYGNDQEILKAELRWTGNPNKWLKVDKERSTKRALREMYKWVERAMDRAYTKSEKQKGLAFVHRNWFRSHDTLTAIRGELEMIIQDREGLEMPKLRTNV